MMHDPYRSVAARYLLLAAASASALWLAAQPATARAQARSAAMRDNAMRKADNEREMEMRQREMMMNDARPANSATARLALAQIGEDFRQMQIVNNEMMRATFSGAAQRAPDYERISKATAEINRRAARLRANLQLPAQEARDEARDAEQEIMGEKELRASLLSLDELIMGFVNNPTFRKQGVLDAQHSSRASRDLQSIIKLSQRIKQRAEKLK